MKYRKNPKNGDELSVLAFGCMRFGRDESETERQILRAVEAGVNYFDTAYIYPNSEATLGRILAKNNLRERVKIATKLPPYLVRKEGDAERIFAAQLERLKTDHIDYYLIHMLPDIKEWRRLCALGLPDWIDAMKHAGKIKNIGFSYHGNSGGFIDILEIADWEFCMMQYNYMDENSQAGRKGLAHATAKGLPVMIMEPLRGGKLARLPHEAAEVLEHAEIKRTPAVWSFRWLWNQPEVTTVLSGMNSMEILEENLRAAETAEAGVLRESETHLYEQVRRILLDRTNVPCTGCAYCMPCPAGVDIPQCFDSYNAKAEGMFQSWFFYILRTNNHNAGLCTSCGRCEAMCPQRIPIRQEMAAARRVMEGFHYKPMRAIVRTFMGL